MKLQPSDLAGLDVYQLMTSLLVPRPIAWTGTRSAAGHDNIAPFSYFMGVGSRPPSIAISVARGAGGALKDTARCILETGVFTVSMVSAALGEAMAVTAGLFPQDVSEFEQAGLQAVTGEVVDAPYPAEARVVMECRRLHAIDMESTHLFVGEVLMWHIDDALVVRGRRGNPLVDGFALDPLSRLGAFDYARLGERLSFVPPKL